MLDLNGKVAVVTGASFGIGRAVAIALAREGCKTILVARGEKGLEETRFQIQQENGSAVALPTDISIPDDINNLYSKITDEFGVIDILWNGAFGWIEGAIEENNQNELIEFFDSSVRGTVLLTSKLMPLLLNSENPHIINVVADWEFPETDGITAFIAAKRALSGMGIALQKEKQGKVKVTNLHPADVASEDYNIDDEVSDVLEKTNKTMIPLKELTEIVLFILKLEATTVHQIDIKPLNQEIKDTFL